MPINVLLLAVLKPGSGNLSTADRIRGYFDDCSRYNCWLKDSNSFKTLQEFHGLLSEKDIHVIIAIHALHSGSLLTGDKFIERSDRCVLSARKSFRNGFQQISEGTSKKLWQERSSHRKQPVANGIRRQTLYTDLLQQRSVVCDKETNGNAESVNGIQNGGHGDGCYGNRCSQSQCRILPTVARTRNGMQSVSRVRCANLLRKRALSVDCDETMIERQRFDSGNSKSADHRHAGRKRSSSLSHLEEGKCRGKAGWEESASPHEPKTVRHIPYALVCAGTDLNEFSKAITSLRVMTRAILGAKFIVSFNEPLLGKVKALWPVLSKAQLKEIPQAVMTFPSDLSINSVKRHFGLCQNAVIFVMVSGIRPVKDPLFLVQTFSDWHLRKRRNAYLLIVGPLMHAEYGKTFLEVINRASGVVYVGARSLADTHALIKGSYALVNSSLSEGMSTAILEAMDVGVPVIARNIPGNRAIIDDNRTGLLYDNATDFLERAESLLSDTAQRTDIIARAKHKIRRRHNCVDERNAYFSLVEKLAES